MGDEKILPRFPADASVVVRRVTTPLLVSILFCLGTRICELLDTAIDKHSPPCNIVSLVIVSCDNLGRVLGELGLEQPEGGSRIGILGRLYELRHPGQDFQGFPIGPRSESRPERVLTRRSVISFPGYFDLVLKILHVFFVLGCLVYVHLLVSAVVLDCMADLTAAFLPNL